MYQKLTRVRLIIAIISTAAEEVAIWAVWRWLLPEFGVELPVSVLIGVMAGWGIFGTWLFIFTTNVLKKQSTAGLHSMVGITGTAVGRLEPGGMVKIRGELWSAVSEQGSIAAGEAIEVTGQKGLKLTVRRAKH